MTVQEQFDVLYTRLATRRRSPVKPATLDAYSSYYRNHIGPELGALPLEEIKNGAVKDFVAKLGAKGLSPATIGGVSQLVKNIVGSAVDENGEELYPRKWNAEYVDAPIINPRDQKAPILSPAELSEALARADKGYLPLFTLLAGSGLRISEAMALKGSPDPVSSYWDREQAIVSVKTQFRKGQEQPPKTPSGVREIDLAPELNAYLRLVIPAQSKQGRLFSNQGYLKLAEAGIPGYHSFRRFRLTHLENQAVPMGFIKFWAGHAGSSTTDRYIKLDSEKEARKTWAARAGLGFRIPE